MARLYQALAPDRAVPRLLSDPIKVLLDRLRLVKLDNLSLGVPDRQPALQRTFPPPRLKTSVLAIHGTACRVLDAAHIYFSRSLGGDTGRWTFIQAQALARALVDEGFALALAGDLDEALRVSTRDSEALGCCLG